MPDGSAYPIIYVRGFAGGTSGIDTATDDSPGGLSFTVALPPAGRHLLGARAALALNVELLT
jgi:hypothetical protein